MRICLKLVLPIHYFGLLVCMLLTAKLLSWQSTQIVRQNLHCEETVSNPILVLAFINGIMMVGRLFAGDIVHRLSIFLKCYYFQQFNMTLDDYSYQLQQEWLQNKLSAVFAIGVCYFWPTMLSFVAEKIPSSGALAIITDETVDWECSRFNRFWANGISLLWMHYGTDICT